jgi:bacterioferritin
MKEPPGKGRPGAGGSPRGSARILQLLNEILVAELTAVNQYFLGARMCRHRGYARLHDRLRHESIEEMKHAERLIDRILYLEGLPNLQKLDKLHVADSPIEQLRMDAALERAAVARLNHGIEAARGAGDNGTAELLEDLLAAAEAHADWLGIQLDLVSQLGDAHYLAQQIKKDE